MKGVGGKVSTIRTADQTQTARFWFEGPGAWNTIARTVAPRAASMPGTAPGCWLS